MFSPAGPQVASDCGSPGPTEPGGGGGVGEPGGVGHKFWAGKKGREGGGRGAGVSLTSCVCRLPKLCHTNSSCP